MVYSVQGVDPKVIGNAAVEEFIAACHVEHDDFDDRHDEYLDNKFNDGDNPDYDPDTISPMKNKLVTYRESREPTPLKAASKNSMEELGTAYNTELKESKTLQYLEGEILTVMHSRFDEMVEAAKIGEDWNGGFHSVNEIGSDDELRELLLPYIIRELDVHRPLPNDVRPYQNYAARGGDLGIMRQQMNLFLEKLIGLSGEGVNLDNDYIYSAVPVMWEEAGVRHAPLARNQIEWISSLAKNSIRDPDNKGRACELLMDAASSVCLGKGYQLCAPFSDIKLIDAEKSLIGLIKRDEEPLSVEQAQMVVGAISVRYPQKDFTSILNQLTEINDIKKVVEAFELHWPDMNAMLSSRHGELTRYMSSSDQSDVMLKVGKDEYTFKSHEIEDCEGHSKRESWMKNEELHRYGGPAKDDTSKHYIAAETHLDNASVSYALEGSQYNFQDLTYERITREKMPNDISNKIDNDEELSHDDEVRLGRLQMM